MDNGTGKGDLYKGYIYWGSRLWVPLPPGRNYTIIPGNYYTGLQDRGYNIIYTITKTMKCNI